jgi:hypothetical protein
MHWVRRLALYLWNSPRRNWKQQNRVRVGAGSGDVKANQKAEIDFGEWGYNTSRL